MFSLTVGSQLRFQFEFKQNKKDRTRTCSGEPKYPGPKSRSVTFGANSLYRTDDQFCVYRRHFVFFERVDKEAGLQFKQKVNETAQSPVGRDRLQTLTTCSPATQSKFRVKPVGNVSDEFTSKHNKAE